MNSSDADAIYKTKVKWRILLLVFLTIGFIDSIYLAYHHYKVNILMPETASFCVINETIDCDRVTTSFGSKFMGVSVATLGMFAHGFLFFFIYIEHLFSFGEKAHLNCFVYITSLLMILFALYELFISFVILNAICIMCVVLYVTVSMIFISSKRVLGLSHREIKEVLKRLFFYPPNRTIRIRLLQTLIISLVLSAVIAFGLDRLFIRQFESANVLIFQ